MTTLASSDIKSFGFNTDHGFDPTFNWDRFFTAEDRIIETDTAIIPRAASAPEIIVISDSEDEDEELPTLIGRKYQIRVPAPSRILCLLCAFKGKCTASRSDRYVAVKYDEYPSENFHRHFMDKIFPMNAFCASCIGFISSNGESEELLTEQGYVNCRVIPADIFFNPKFEIYRRSLDRFYELIY